MSLGLAAITFLHVVLSLIGIGTGFVVLCGLFCGNRLDLWTAIFLSSTVATSATGFLFPFVRFLPSHALGILSLGVLAVAIIARYKGHLAGAWRWVYVLGAVTVLYLNVLVLVVQLFLKVPALAVLAPTRSEPAFVLTQLVVLAVFVLFALIAVIRFRTEPVRSPQSVVSSQ